LCHWNFSLT